MIPSESYRKVHYELRPAKQVERRMLVDGLQLLAADGKYQIRDYQYTGMGSIYFIDFIMMHKLLGIERLVSVEFSEAIRKRVYYNKPYGLIGVEIQRIGDYIPSLSPDLQHLLWLDYDSLLDEEQLRDISLAGTYLASGSIFLVTIDAEPPVPVENGGSPPQWMDYYLDIAGNFARPSWGAQDFALSELPRRNVEIAIGALKAGLIGRRDVQFLPMFNFVYADGHRMVTVGGMIGSKTDRRRLKGNRLSEASYFRSNLKDPPYEISVPLLTRRERLFMDSRMPCADQWTPKDFELDADDVRAYREIYRFLPVYAEFLF